MLFKLFEALVYVLALYGLLNIVGNFLDSLIKDVRFTKTNYNLVLSVKNQQDNIEAVIRAIFEDELFRRGTPDCKVVVIDKGSSDETLPILKKLQKEFTNLEVVEENNHNM